jgi:flagellar biosynthesis chaperone FliJ
MLEMKLTDTEKANLLIEQSVGEMYRAFFQLRQLREYQEEYDAMGVIINMLMKDRQVLREKHGVKI